MKPLTDSVKDVATALQNSSLLKLSDDKLKVKRVSAVVQKGDLDDYTIYVESLPPNADHDWIINTMSVFGAINYVSLPRYRKTRKIKEFAFVEFEQKSSVEKALRAFEEFGGVITAEKNPEELLSVTTYIAENEETIGDKTPLKVVIRTDEEVVVATKETETEDVPPAKKLKLEQTVVAVVPSDVEIKAEVLPADGEKEVTDVGNSEELTDDNEKTGEDNDEEDDEIVDNVDGKKKRKRIRKKKMEFPEYTKVSTTADSITDLRITSK